jgi:hypothetical protein
MVEIEITTYRHIGMFCDMNMRKYQSAYLSFDHFVSETDRCCSILTHILANAQMDLRVFCIFENENVALVFDSLRIS